VLPEISSKATDSSAANCRNAAFPINTIID
jgi:hypothetical protein